MNMNMYPTATATLLLIAAFIGGLFAGVLVERVVLGSVPDAHAAEDRKTPREGGRFDRERMAADLDLTADQRERIDAILDEQQRQVRAIMRETRPRTREVLHETRIRVEEILTPEQRTRWEEMHPRGDKPERNGEHRE